MTSQTATDTVTLKGATVMAASDREDVPDLRPRHPPRPALPTARTFAARTAVGRAPGIPKDTSVTSTVAMVFRGMSATVRGPVRASW
jgi:hypothetical protein